MLKQKKSKMKQEELVEAMQKDLDAYKADKSRAKQLFASMKEIYDWLKAKEK